MARLRSLPVIATLSAKAILETQCIYSVCLLLCSQGTNRSSGSRGSSEDDPPYVAGPHDTAGVAKRQRRMAEKNRQVFWPFFTSFLHMVLSLHVLLGTA